MGSTLFVHEIPVFWELHWLPAGFWIQFFFFEALYDSAGQPSITEMCLPDDI